MTIRSVLLLAILALFGTLTGIALMDVGYFGIIEPHFKSWGAGQVLADLVIMCVLACVWMVGNARMRGTNVWPFVVLTLVAGSFGPLAYLLVRELRSEARTKVAE